MEPNGPRPIQMVKLPSHLHFMQTSQQMKERERDRRRRLRLSSLVLKHMGSAQDAYHAFLQGREGREGREGRGNQRGAAGNGGERRFNSPFKAFRIIQF